MTTPTPDKQTEREAFALPELPPSFCHGAFGPLYNRHEMREYARQAVYASEELALSHLSAAQKKEGEAQKRKDWQQRAIELGFTYWRAPDAHGVTGTPEKAIALLEELLGVEVNVEPTSAAFPMSTAEEYRSELHQGDCYEENCPGCLTKPQAAAEAQADQWTLISPEGKRWTAPTKMMCVAAETAERVPYSQQVKNILDAVDEAPALTEVTREDANNYCRILSILGMEEEGDPVAEVQRLATPTDSAVNAGAVTKLREAQSVILALLRDTTDYGSPQSVAKRCATDFMRGMEGFAPKADSSESNHLENIYAFLCSVAPEGIADEAFRNVPEALLATDVKNRITQSGASMGKEPSPVHVYDGTTHGCNGGNGTAIADSAEAPEVSDSWIEALPFGEGMTAMKAAIRKGVAAMGGSDPKAQPLTDEQIDALDTFSIGWMAPRGPVSRRDFARAIEAAHGIASSTTGDK